MWKQTSTCLSSIEMRFKNLWSSNKTEEKINMIFPSKFKQTCSGRSAMFTRCRCDAFLYSRSRREERRWRRRRRERGRERDREIEKNSIERFSSLSFWCHQKRKLRNFVAFPFVRHHLKAKIRRSIWFRYRDLHCVNEPSKMTGKRLNLIISQFACESILLFFLLSWTREKLRHDKTSRNILLEKPFRCVTTRRSSLKKPHLPNSAKDFR